MGRTLSQPGHHAGSNDILKSAITPQNPYLKHNKNQMIQEK